MLCKWLLYVLSREYYKKLHMFSADTIFFSILGESTDEEPTDIKS